MGNILEEIAEITRARVIADAATRPLEDLITQAEGMYSSDGLFKTVLAKPSFSFICDVKKATPAKGVVDEEFLYKNIIRSYKAAGIEAVSCVTEPQYFMGSDQVFCDIRDEIRLALLRRDFVVDEYQIYQAKCMGADAVLLTVALVDAEALAKFIELTHRLGMDALVEVQNAEEVAVALGAGAQIIGINCVDLEDFSVSADKAVQLYTLIPDNRICIAENAVETPEDVAKLAAAGINGALVGEPMMCAKNKTATIRSYRRAAAEAMGM